MAWLKFNLTTKEYRTSSDFNEDKGNFIMSACQTILRAYFTNLTQNWVKYFLADDR